MSRNRNCCKAILASGIWLLTPLSTNAATVNLPGDNFSVSYDDGQSGISLYGAPSYGPGSDTISFTQTDFVVESTDGDGALESLTSEVTFTLTRNESTFNFLTLNLFEFGNYLLNGAGASVNVTGNMRVQTHSSIFTNGSAYVPGPPTIAPLTDLTINDNVSHDWFGSAFADLVNSGQNAPNFGGGSNDFSSYDSIIVTIENTLQANTTQLGSFASIQKISAGGTVQLGVNGVPASAVPVPAAAWLMISGLLGLIGVARRK